MLALFNGWVAKGILMLVTAVFLNPNVAQLKQVDRLIPTFKMSVESNSDSLDVDKDKKDSEGSVKISITDDGIKIHSGGENQFILGIDSLRAIKSMMEKSIQAIPESLSVKLKYLSENNSVNFIYGDEREYSHVIKKDYIRVGEKIWVEENEFIQGDVISVMGGVKVEGKVSGDVVSVLGNIELGSTAVVNGDVVCILGHLTKASGTKVRGETVNVGSDKFTFPNITFLPVGGGILRFIVQIAKFIVLVLLLLLILYFTSDRMKVGSSYVTGSFFKSMGIGILILVFGSIVIVIASVILGITIIGIPLSFLLVLSYIALMLFCYFISSLAIGSFIARKMKIAKQSVYMQGLIGLFLLELPALVSSAMGVIPIFKFVKIPIGIVGKFIVFLALLVGVGAFVLSKGGVLPAKSDNLIEG